MEATKVRVAQQTLDLNKLDKRRKTDLRRKLIIEHIQSKPSGEIIRMAEFQRVGQFSTTPNTNAFMNRMLRDGVVMRYKGDRPKTYYYAVTGAVRTKKLKVATDGIEHAQPRPAATVTANHSLTEYAKQFAWEHNSDSLREFVEYMDGKELELRRQADVI